MSGHFPLASLPDDIAVQVISRLPLVDQFSVGQVSTRFRRLMSRALCLVDSLTVVLDDPNGLYRMDAWFGDTLSQDHCSYIKLDGMTDCDRDALLGIRRIERKVTLRFSNEDRVNLHWLSTSMPNVRKLVYVRNGGNWNVGQVTSLLHEWAPSLTSLTILVYPAVHRMTIEQSTRLFGAINKLVHLQDLFVEFVSLFEAVRLDLPILSRLRRFHFYSEDASNQLLLASLRQYVPHNRALKQILLGKRTCIGQYLPDFIRLDQRITSKITGLVNSNQMSNKATGPMIELLCSKFTSLTYLMLKVTSPVYTPAQLASALSRLSQLYFLDLDLSDAANMKINPPEVNQDRMARAEGPQLSTIQVLHLSWGESYNHRDLSHIYDFSHTFPGLRALVLKDFAFCECVRCRVQKMSRRRAVRELKSGYSRVGKRPRKCTRGLTSTFGRCTLIETFWVSHSIDDVTYIV